MTSSLLSVPLKPLDRITRQSLLSFQARNYEFDSGGTNETLKQPEMAKGNLASPYSAELAYHERGLHPVALEEC